MTDPGDGVTLGDGLRDLGVVDSDIELFSSQWLSISETASKVIYLKLKSIRFYVASYLSTFRACSTD